MPNYLVVLLLSVSVLLGAFYVHTVERRIIQINEELLQHGNEKMKVKKELKSTSEAITQVKVEFESTIQKLKQELESTKKELKQELEPTKKELIKELESTRKELKQELESNRKELKQELESNRKELKQEKVELDSTRVQIDVLREEKENARREEIDLIRTDVNTLLETTKAQDIRTVAFYALLTHDEINPGTRHIIAFDLVRTNIHDSYNHFTGAFTAPIYGVYGFIYSLRMNCHDTGTFEIMKNDEVKGTIHVNVHNGCSGQFSTGSIVVVLNIKETVYVRTHSTVIPSGRIHSNINGAPHFAGWLIASL